MKQFITIFIMLIFTSSIFAQGFYLDKGQSGFGVDGGFSTNDDVTGFGGGIGYSVNGIFDFGIGINKFSFDQQFLGADLNATSISPSITFHALKQNDKIPLSFAIGAGYSWQTYSNDVLDENNVDMTSEIISFTGSLYSYYIMSDSFRIQPAIGFTYMTGEIKIEDNNGNEETDEDNTSTFHLGLGLLLNISENNKFVIFPQVGISDENTTYGIGLSFVIGINQ